MTDQISAFFARNRICGSCPQEDYTRDPPVFQNGEPACLVILSSPCFELSVNFILSRFRNIRLEDFALICFPLCGDFSNRNALTACKSNIGKISSFVHPGLIVPCGKEACALFDLDYANSEIYMNVYLSRGRSGRGRAVIVMPLQDSFELVSGMKENTERYLFFLDRLYALKIVTAGLRSGMACENYLDCAGIEYINLFS